MYYALLRDIIKDAILFTIAHFYEADNVIAIIKFYIDLFLPAR